MRRLIVLPVFLALAAPAQGALPPNGKYECVIGSNSILFGNLVVKGKAYKHRGTRGTISGTKKDLRFKGGDLGGMRGRWYKSSTGVVEIALRNPRDGFESIYCTRS